MSRRIFHKFVIISWKNDAKRHTIGKKAGECMKKKAGSAYLCYVDAFTGKQQLLLRVIEGDTGLEAA